MQGQGATRVAVSRAGAHDGCNWTSISGLVEGTTVLGHGLPSRPIAPNDRLRSSYGRWSVGAALSRRRSLGEPDATTGRISIGLKVTKPDKLDSAIFLNRACMTTGGEEQPEKLRRLGLHRPITRRDFIDGIAVTAAVLPCDGWAHRPHPDP